MAVSWGKLAYENDVCLRAPRVTSIASSATPTPNADITDIYTITA